MRSVDINSDGEMLLKSALSRSELLPKHEAKPQVFRYQQPDLKDRPRAITRLFTSDLMCGLVQVIKKGGEATLHSHAAMDGLWMVISGRARFYSDKETLMGEFGPMEGVYIPRNVKYWFESVHEDPPLQILQIEGFVQGQPNVYTSYGERPSEENLARQAAKIQFMDASEPATTT